MSQTISPQSALIYAMVMVSAADGEMSDRELETIGDVIRKFPIFAGFDTGRLVQIAAECSDILSEDEGLATVLGLIEEVIPERLYETAYAAMVEVASADEVLKQEELRLLKLTRDRLGIDRLRSGAIEHSARVRHRTL